MKISLSNNQRLKAEIFRHILTDFPFSFLSLSFSFSLSLSLSLSLSFSPSLSLFLQDSEDRLARRPETAKRADFLIWLRQPTLEHIYSWRIPHSLLFFLCFSFCFNAFYLPPTTSASAHERAKCSLVGAKPWSVRKDLQNWK